MSTLGD